MHRPKNLARSLDRRLARLAPMALAVTALSMACIQGARAPQVPPRGTLAPGEMAASGDQPADGPFGVVFAAPKGQTEDPSEVTLVFNRPLRALDVAGSEAAPKVTLTPAVPGRWAWVGTSALAFTPEGGALPRATEFTVEVPAGTRSLDGEAMPSAYTFRFATARPKVLDVDVATATGAEDAGVDPNGIEPTATFLVRFNQPVEPAEVTRAVTLVAFGEKDGAPGKPPARIPFELRRPDPKDPRLFALAPRARLPLDAPVTLAVDASLHGREGPLPASAPASYAFHTYGPLRVARVDCSDDTPRRRCAVDSGFSIELSNPVKLSEIKRALRVSPPIALRFPSWIEDDEPTRSVSLFGRFTPGKTYRADLAAGSIKDVHGQPLASGYSKEVAFDDLWPSAAVGLSGSILDPAASRAIPVAQVNAKDGKLATARLTEAQILAFEQGEGDRGRSLSFEEVKAMPGAKLQKLPPTTTVNRPATELVRPEDVLGGKDRRGPFAVAVSFTERPGTQYARVVHRSAIAQVTDLAISAKISPRGSLVWVTRLGSAQPASGARVRVARPGAPALVEVTTDKDGFAMIPSAAFAPAAGEPERAVIFASLGDDWTYRRVAETLDSYRFGVSVDLGTERPVGMLFTDRGIYRPGEAVLLKGIFREETAKGAGALAGKRVTLTVEAPDGKSLAERTETLSAFGTIAAEIPIPLASRLGTYTIQAKLDDSPRSYPDVSEGFEVAEYRPAEFKVSVASDRPSYVRGDKASWTARGDYLFGAPMAGSEARLSITRAETSFTPPGTDGFTTDDAAFLEGQTEATPREGELQNAKAKLDDKGAASIAATLALPGQRRPELVTCEADVTDLSRQLISSSTSAVVHPGEFYLALDPGPELFRKTGEAVRPRVLAVDPKGGRVAQVPVTLELVQRRWSLARQEVGGGFRSVSTAVDKVVARCAITSAAEPASCALDPSGPGYYLVRAAAVDRRKNPIAASSGLYVTGDAGEVGFADSDRMQVELVPDRSSYEVGKTARILVKSPFTSAEALVTVERAGITSRRRVTLTGPTPTIEIPVTEDLRPNAFVSVLLIRGRSKPAPASPDKPDVGAPAFRVGYAPIAVNPEARRLAIALRPSRAELRPGDPIDVDLDVKDRSGKPARAEVTLWAVDEGVLSRIAYRTPDPIPVFGAPRALRVATAESRADLARVMNPLRELGLDKGLEGGSGGEGGGVRKDFRPSAYWNAALVTDGAGRARAHFKLPDGLTTYRIMAVAVAEDDRFGYADTRVVTSRPLMARPALPRFVRAGDSLDASFILTSKGLPRTRVEAEIAVEGLTLTGPSTRSLDLEANGSAEVRFALEAQRAGPAKVRLRARGGGAEDTVEVTRAVSAPIVPEAVALYGDTTRASAELLGDLSSLRDDVGGLEVSLASTALVGLGDGVEQLIQYPYGCTEQLTSRLVPLLPLRDLARDFKISLPSDLGLVIDKTIAKILSHQRADGGFGLWAESSESSPWFTAYALWGLQTAKRYRVAVPEGSIEAATRYLREALLRIGSDTMLTASAPFILDVLAEGGSPDPGRVSTLFDARQTLPLFARAELLHAMVLSKIDSASVAKLAGEIEGSLRLDGDAARAVTTDGERYAELLDSDTRTSALTLRALLAANPAHALGARLARGLLAVRRGGAWRTTQETAFALLALDAYRKAQEKAEPSFTARVFLGQAQLFEADFRGRSLSAPRTSIPAKDLVGAGGAPLAFDVSGTGRLFYEARLRYAKKELPDRALERGFFVKKSLRVVSPEGLAEALAVTPDGSASAFKGGDLVLADVVVVTPSPRDFVVIDDPLPAGFEGVDARLATTGAAYDVDRARPEGNGDGDGDGDGDEGHGAFEPSRFLREIRDDRVLFFIDHLSAGMFHYRYLARATTLGSFVLPPTHAEEMYTPETFGRTAAARVRVGAR